MRRLFGCSLSILLCVWAAGLMLGCRSPRIAPPVFSPGQGAQAEGIPGTLAESPGGTQFLPALRSIRAAVPVPAAKAKRLLLVPMEIEPDQGAANGNATFLRLQPAYEWPLGRGWRIQNLDIITVANVPGGVTGTPGNPAPVAGARATGLGDLVHASFLAPDTRGSLVWGAGVAVGLPTATDDVLGSGKWSAGPALRATWRKGAWSLGAIGSQRWSFAGASNRASISQLMVRGAFRRELGNDWYLVSAPIITANWNATSSERWLVPLGGGVGKSFDCRGIRWAASVQAYGNVVRPTGAPEWSFRVGLTAIIPLSP